MRSSTSTNNYREILQAEYEERSTRNPAYSMRSFARDIGLSPSTLSEVVKGRYGLSRARAEDIGKRLGFSEWTCRNFADLVEASHGRSTAAREAARLRLVRNQKRPQFRNMDLDEFKIIADWYHFAILVLCETRDFSWDKKWIGRELDIDPAVVGAAISRLEREGLLLRTSENSWSPPEKFTFAGKDVPSKAIRQFHRQVLAKASAALETQAVEKREYTSHVFAIDSAKIAAAKEAIRKFHEEFCVELADGPNAAKNEVYCLTTAFFSLKK